MSTPVINNNVQNRTDLEGAAITALAAASKTPFKTAFFAALGLGAARLLLFVGGLIALAAVGVTVTLILK